MKPSESLVSSWVQSALISVFWNMSDDPVRHENQEDGASWRFTYYPRTRTCTLSGRGPDSITGLKFKSLHAIAAHFGYTVNINTSWNTDAK